MSESVGGSESQWVRGSCADAQLDARLRELLVALIKSGDVVGMQVRGVEGANASVARVS